MKDDFNRDDEDKVLNEIFEDDEDDLDELESGNYSRNSESSEPNYSEDDEDEEDNYEDEDNEDVVNSKNRNVANSKKKNVVKSNPSRNKSFYFKILAWVGSILVLIMCLLFVNKYELISQGKVGVNAVKLLYDFNNINDLANNLEDLRGMMTEKCYYKTTVLNSDKSLNTYLKLKKKATKVNIIDSKPGFVLYSLENENITESRLFIFSYRLNLFGDIYDVREFEAIDFYSEAQSVSDEELDKLIEQWNSEEQ